MQNLSVVDLLGRVILDSSGDAYTVVDITVDAHTGAYSLELAEHTEDDIPGGRRLTLESFSGWTVIPDDFTPEDVAAGLGSFDRSATTAPASPAEGAGTTPFTPENILIVGGRFFHDGHDVTELPIAWLCSAGHGWWATLAHRTSSRDKGCPECAPGTRARTRTQQKQVRPKNKRRRKR